jgi:hypothetical protein
MTQPLLFRPQRQPTVWPSRVTAALRRSLLRLGPRRPDRFSLRLPGPFSGGSAPGLHLTPALLASPESLTIPDQRLMKPIRLKKSIQAHHAGVKSNVFRYGPETGQEGGRRRPVPGPCRPGARRAAAPFGSGDPAYCLASHVSTQADSRIPGFGPRGSGAQARLWYNRASSHGRDGGGLGGAQ